MTERVKLGQQYQQANRPGRRIIGVEVRVAPGDNLPQEEIFMDGLDVELPLFDPYGPGLSWSVTLHTTNGDVTLDSRQTGQHIRL